MKTTVTFECQDEAEAVALIALVGATGSSGSLDEDGTAGKKEPKAKSEVKIEDVQKVLQAYAAEHGKDGAMKLLKKHGKVDRLKDLPEGKFAAVIKAAS